MAWTHTHDIAYSFLCVAFMADGAVDNQELEAIRGNVLVLLPNVPPDEFDSAMIEAVQRFADLEYEKARTRFFDTCLASLKGMFQTTEGRYTFIKNLAYIVRADDRIFDKEVELVERAVTAIGMGDVITLERKATTLFVHKR